MKLYHLTNKLFAKTVCLKPHVNTIIDDFFEVSKPERVCFSNNIQNCANAVYGYNVKISNSYYSVYEIEIDGDEDYFVSNDCIVKNKLVFDADQHNECWITKPVIAKKVAKIKIKRTKDCVFFKPLRELSRNDLCYQKVKICDFKKIG